MGGRCSFQEKAIRAAGAGAVALIVISDTDGVIAMGEEDGLDLALHVESGELGQVVAMDAAGVCEVNLPSGDILTTARASLLMASDVAIPLAMVSKDAPAQGLVPNAPLLLASTHKPILTLRADLALEAGSSDSRSRGGPGSGTFLFESTVGKELPKSTESSWKSLDALYATVNFYHFLPKEDVPIRLGQVGVGFTSFRWLFPADATPANTRDSADATAESANKLSQGDASSANKPAEGDASSAKGDASSAKGGASSEKGDASSNTGGVSSAEASPGVSFQFVIDPRATGMEAAELAGFLRGGCARVTLWGRAAARFFPLGVVSVPLFPLLLQRR
ncbi:hypothetical protein T484DRAFT_1795551, partial [Baffinella frigidus]